jgi:transcription antitermination factor NusG
MSQWSLLRVNAQSQHRFVDFMDDNQPEIEYYFPKYDRVIRNSSGRDRKAGKMITVPTPVYPGYVFVKEMFESAWRLAQVRCPVRASFVRFGGEVGLVDSRVIEGLRRLEVSGGLVQVIKVENPYLPGRKVRVHTPVASISAIILQCTNHGARALVETSLCRITVPIHQVELI